MAPAERADLIVDLRLVPAGSTLILYNDAPAPFPVGDPRNDYYPGNPKTPSVDRGIRAQHPDAAADQGELRRSAPAVPADHTARRPDCPNGPVPGGADAGCADADPGKGGPCQTSLTLNETFDAHGRLIQYLGTNVATGLGGPGLFGRHVRFNTDRSRSRRDARGLGDRQPHRRHAPDPLPSRQRPDPLAPGLQRQAIRGRAQLHREAPSPPIRMNWAGRRRCG